MAYLTTTQFKARASLPSSYVDAVEASSPGYTQHQLDLASAYIDGRLAKRYAVPFNETTPPLCVVGWLIALVSLEIWKKRGLDATQLDAQVYIDAAENVRKELSEAADSKEGRWDLPLRSDTTASGVSKPKLRSYSETSPFVGQRIQRQRGREEDCNGTGTKH